MTAESSKAILERLEATISSRQVMRWAMESPSAMLDYCAWALAELEPFVGREEVELYRMTLLSYKADALLSLRQTADAVQPAREFLRLVEYWGDDHYDRGHARTRYVIALASNGEMQEAADALAVFISELAPDHLRFLAGFMEELRARLEPAIWAEVQRIAWQILMSGSRWSKEHTRAGLGLRKKKAAKSIPLKLGSPGTRYRLSRRTWFF